MAFDVTAPGSTRTLPIQGLDGALARMRALPEKLQKKGLSRALGKGARIVRVAAQRNARKIDDPKTSEMIARNITTKTDSRLGKREGGAAVKVGVRGGAKSYKDNKLNRRKQRVGQQYATAGSSDNPGGDTWYWRFVEFGVPSLGIPARPILQPALAENDQRAITAIVDELNIQLDKLAAGGSL